MATVSVIGTGYLGAVHAACLAHEGHDVVGIDMDPTRVSALAAGEAPFFEPRLDELLTQVQDRGRLRFTTDYREASDCDVHFLCVGTPQRSGELGANTEYVFGAARALAPHVRPDSLVVGKSTVPVGTAHQLSAVLEQTTGGRVRLAWNPEFLREGFAIQDTLRPDRLVYGVRPGQSGSETEADVELLDRVYGSQLASGTPRLVVDWATSELVKVAANAFLATKISFINAMAEVCEAGGGDVVALAQALGMDRRIGPEFLRAGLGFGGGCLPKDIRAFRARAAEIGAGKALDFLAAVDDVNQRRRDRVLELSLAALGGRPEGKRIAILGAAFKPNSDDIRDSPALAVAEAARRLGASVTVHDPKALRNAKLVAPELNYADTVLGACESADLVLHLTEWAEYRESNPAELARVVAVPTLIDARNVLDIAAWRRAGWTVTTLGRPNA